MRSFFSLSFWHKKTFFKILARIQNGALLLTDEQGVETLLGDPNASLRADLQILHPAFYQRVLFGAEIGAAESYMAGEWSTRSLTPLMQLIAENMFLLDDIIERFSFIRSPFHTLSHYLRANTPKTARKNIAAHYDLGNHFYAQFLDEQMLYSSALFHPNVEGNSLEEAQRNKMHRLCEQLVLLKDDHVLEIGSGWGAMAEFIAREYGCHVTTTTISEQQYVYTQERIKLAGLSDKVTVLREDYRALKGQFDKIVSIEMIEAVGKAYLPVYFQQCARLLKPQGKLAIQAIIIDESRYRTYSQRVDFIQRYIFPGGFLPALSTLQDNMQQNQFEVNHVFHMGNDYAMTLSRWRERFMEKWPVIQDLGFDEAFQRLWLFYLSYCEAGFLTKTTHAIQITAKKIAT